jgi:hypothetical protein
VIQKLSPAADARRRLGRKGMRTIKGQVAAITGGTHAFRNTMNAVLGRAKDGEGRASVVEPIFGNLIYSVHMKGSPNCWRKPAGGSGAEGETNYSKVKQRFYLI